MTLKSEESSLGELQPRSIAETSEDAQVKRVAKEALHWVRFQEAIKFKDIPVIRKEIQDWWQQEHLKEDRKNGGDAFLLFCNDFQLNQSKDSLSEQWQFVEEEFRLWEYFKDIVTLSDFKRNGNPTADVRLLLDGIESLKKHSVQHVAKGTIHRIRLNSEMLTQIANLLRVVSKDHATWKYFQVFIDRLRLPLLNYEALVNLQDELHLLQVRLVRQLTQCPNIGQILQQYSKTLSEIRQDLLDWRFERMSCTHLDKLHRMVAKQLPDGGAGVVWSVEDQEELELLKDIESLEQIVAYVDVALVVDVEADGTMGRWTIERALQVAGEFIKDTEESPNLSTTTASSFQEASLPLSAMRSIRNALSHAMVSNLVVRQVAKDDQYDDAGVLRNLLKDLHKVRSTCTKALSRKRFHFARNSIAQLRPIVEHLFDSEVNDAFAEVLASSNFSVIQETLDHLGEVLQRHGGPYESTAERVREIQAESAHWKICKSLRDLRVSAASTFAFCEEHLEDSDVIDQQLERLFNPRIVPILSSTHSKYVKSMFTRLPTPTGGIERMAKMTSPQKFRVLLGKEESWKEFVATTYEENLPAHHLSDPQSLDDHRLTVILAELQGLKDAELATARLLVLQKLLRMKKLKDLTIANREPLARGAYEELVKQMGLEEWLTQDLQKCNPEGGLPQGEVLFRDILQGLDVLVNLLGNALDDSGDGEKVRLMGFDERQLATLNEMLQEFRKKVKQKWQVECRIDQMVDDLLKSLPTQPLVQQVEAKRQMHQVAVALRSYCNGAEMTKAQFLSLVDAMAGEILSQIETLKSSCEEPAKVTRWLLHCRNWYETLVVAKDHNRPAGQLRQSDPRAERVRKAIKSLKNFDLKQDPRSRFDNLIAVLEQAVLERVAELKSSYPDRTVVERLLRSLQDPYDRFLKKYARHQNGTLETTVKDFRNFVATFDDGHDVDLLIDAYRDVAAVHFEDFFNNRLATLGVLLAGEETIDALSTKQESLDRTYRRFWQDVKLQAATEMVLLDLFNTLKFLSTKKSSGKAPEVEPMLHVYDCLEKIVQMSIRLMAAGPAEMAASLSLPGSIRNALAHEYATSFSVKVLFLLATLFVQEGTTVMAIRHLLVPDGSLQALRLLLGSGYEAFETFVDDHFRSTSMVISSKRQADVLMKSNFWAIDEWKASVLNILDGGTDKRRADPHDDHFLHRMLQEDFLDAVRTDDVAKLEYCWVRNVETATKTVMIPPVHQAVWHGSQQVLHALLQKCGMDVDCPDVWGWTPLHTSIVAQRPALTDLLLDKYQAVMYCKTSKDMFMALHLAALQSDLAMVRLLLKHRAYPDVEAANGWTPMSIAQKLGSDDIRKALLKAGAKDQVASEQTRAPQTLSGSDPCDSQDDELWAILEKAVSSGHSDAVDNILRKRNVDVERKDPGGATLLLKAAMDGKSRIVEILLKHGAKVDATDIFLRTPLMEAVSMGHLNTVRVLLNHGGDVNAKDQHGVTALISAVFNKDAEVIGELLNRGAEVNSRMATARTALLAAVEVRDLDTVRLLLERGADVNLADVNGTTALILAAVQRQWSIFRLLLENGADVEAVDRSQESQLYKAATEGLKEVAQLLLQHGADVHRTTESGRTPLMNAALHGDLEMVELLLSHGAELHVRDVRGETAQSLAATGGHAVIVRLLEMPRDTQRFKAIGAYFDVLKTFQDLLLR